jgi:hypothetical protein
MMGLITNVQPRNVATVNYTPLAGSLQFNGTSHFLSLSPGFALGAIQYTIEGWFYNNLNYTSTRALVAPQHPSGAVNALSLFTNDAQSFTLDAYGGGGTRTYTFPNNTLQVNKWHYIILNRNPNQRETMWVGTFANTSSLVTCIRATSCSGGTSISAGTQLNNINYSGVTNNIGKYYGGYWPGFITNLRATVGRNVYDSLNDSTVTAPTEPLTSLDFTKYLMLGANVTLDTSGTQTITANGSVTQSATVPF